MSAVLDGNDLQSVTWGKLEKYYTAKLEEERADNDHPGDTDTTTLRRGRISAIKNFLDLAQQARQEDVNDGS